jgi:putative addiction module component (TIGR02574 family)
MIKMQEILDLSVAERILIIEKIWASIDTVDDIEVTEAIEEELDKRLSRYNKGETKFYSWDQIRSELNTARS